MDHVVMSQYITAGFFKECVWDLSPRGGGGGERNIKEMKVNKNLIKK
jgi:hypothetical protein